jgi:DNA-binding MltR family transcriptional regulator
MIQRIKRERENNPPGEYANENVMVDWLQANGCLADISMRKKVLYGLIEN